MAEPRNKPPVKDEIATARKDIDLFAGYLTRLENPDPVLRSEAYGKGLKLYDEVRRDAHAGSVLRTRGLSVAGKEWEVLPADDTPAAQEVADFVWEAVKNTNMTTAIAEIMRAVLYGFYVAEVMWEARDGRWVPARLICKHPRRFCFTPERELRLLTLANMVDGEEVPSRKFIAFTWGDTDNPYGCGLGQELYWPVWFKKNGVKFWLIFLEKFGAPTAVGKYPPGTPPDQQQALLNALEALQSEAGIKIPDNMQIALLEAARAGQAGFEKLPDFMDRQISKSVLGQTLTTEVKGEGSFAASKTHDEVRGDIIKADADVLCDCLNASLVRWIVEYNFPTGTPFPKLWIRVEEEQDLKPLAERDKILVSEIGVPVEPEYFYSTYGLPAPAAGAEVIGRAPTPASPFAPAVAPPPEFAERQRFTPDQQRLEELGDAGAAAGQALFAANEAAIRQAISGAANFAEAKARLAALDLDVAPLARRIEESMFAARMFGRLTARVEASDGE